MRGPTERFRDQVLLALHAAGYIAAHKAPQSASNAPQVHGDILGVPGVTIAVRNQRHIALAEAADEVKREALAEGNPVYVSIQARRSSNDENALNAYCTMPLHVLLKMLQRLDHATG